MIGQTVIFDGHRLNDDFYVGIAEVGLPEFLPDVEERPVADGSVLKGMRMGTVLVTVPLVAKTNAGMRAEEALADLLSWLDVDEPKRLLLSEDRGRWRLAVPYGTPNVQDYEWNDRVTVQFLQLDPALYGREESVTVPSGGSVTIGVGGDYPTFLNLRAEGAVRDSSTSQWGVRLDEADFLHFTIPISQAVEVDADCRKRTCVVDGTTTIPTLTSDWLELSPGRHTLRNDLGNGECVISWVERWHR